MELRPTLLLSADTGRRILYIARNECCLDRGSNASLHQAAATLALGSAACRQGVTLKYPESVGLCVDSYGNTMSGYEGFMFQGR